MDGDSLPRGGLATIKTEKTTPKAKVKQEQIGDLFKDASEPLKKKRKLGKDGPGIKLIKQEVLFTKSEKGKKVKIKKEKTGGTKSQKGKDTTNAAADDEVRNKKQQTQEKKGKKKKLKQEQTEENRLEPQELIVKHIKESMLILGYVTEIHDTHLNMALPNGRHGQVQITNISDEYLACLKKFSEMSEEDAESEAFHSLSELFKVGMLLACRVMKNTTISPVAQLSVNPRHVNEHLTVENLNNVPFFYASVGGLEDTGYIIETGVGDTQGFLKNKHAKNYVQNCNNGERLKIGQIIRCQVLKEKSGKKTSQKYIPLTVNPDQISQADLSPGGKLDELIPGMRVKAVVKEIKEKKGMLVSCIKKTGILHYSQLPKALSTYNIGDKIDCCVLYTRLNSHYITLTALPHIVSYTGAPTHLFGFGNLCVGRYLGDAEISKVNQEKGMYFKLEGKAKGIAKMDNLDKDENYEQGSSCRCIVTSIDYVKNRVKVSLKMDTIKAMLRPEDLVGQTVPCKVVNTGKEGISLSVFEDIHGHMHNSQKTPDSKYETGKTITCRVLSCSKKGKLSLTDLPNIVNSTYPVITQPDQLELEQIVEGFVFSTGKILHITFYDGLKGIVMFSNPDASKFPKWSSVVCQLKKYEESNLLFILKKQNNKERSKTSVEVSDRKRKLSENMDDVPKQKREKTEATKIPIPSQHAGQIIGVGGKTVKEISQASDTRINIKPAEKPGGDRVCEIHGSEDAVEKAKKLINDKLEELKNEVSTEFRVPFNKAGSIVGPKGKTIKQIQSQTNTRINVKQGKVTISGTKDSVDQAKKVIMEIVPEIDSEKAAGSKNSEGTQDKREKMDTDDKENDEDADESNDSGGSDNGSGDDDDDDNNNNDDDDDDSGDEGNDKEDGDDNDDDEDDDDDKNKENDVDDKTKIKKDKAPESCRKEIIIPKGKIGKLMGKRGANINNIRKVSGAAVFTKNQEDGNVLCTMSGKEEAVKIACDMVNKILLGDEERKGNNREEITIPNSKIGKVIGAKGATIKYIQTVSMAKVSIKTEEKEGDGICVIIGTEEAVNIARDSVNKLLNDDETADKEGHVKIEVTIPSDKVGLVIGKGGAGVKFIRKKFGIKIAIQEADSDRADRVCEITGRGKSVEKAKSHVMNIIEAVTGAKDKAEEREVKDADTSDSESEAEEADMSDDDDNSHVTVNVLIPGDSVEELKHKPAYTRLHDIDGVKLVLEHEDGQTEGVCTISGQEDVVIDTKHKLEKLLKTIHGKKSSKDLKPGLQLTDSISWDTEFKMPSVKDEGSSSEDESEQKAVKKTKQQIRKEKQDEEKRLHEYEMKKLEGEVIPETADDFDRLVVTSPDSSVVWLRYMAFHLETSEIDKAREVAERALKTISFREDREKQNVWVAYLNLENMYGSKDSLSKVLARAIQYCEPLDIYLPLTNIYIESDKIEDAERIYSTIVKKYSGNKMVWVKFGEFYFQQNRAESARNLLQRSLKALENRDHVETITKFAQLEFKYGEPERGKTMFENVLSTYPKRTDIWSVYVDLLTKLKDHDVTRSVYRKMIGLKLQAKKIKFFFKKYLEFEERYGTPTQAEEVKKKALEFVELGGIQD